MNTTSELVFVDSNVLVFAHDPHEGTRHDTAVATLAKLWRDEAGVLSTQVLHEFYNVVTQRMRRPMSAETARGIVADYSEWCSVDTDPQSSLVFASVLGERHKLRWWDALLLEGALRSGATTLLSEEFEHGQRFGRLTVRNPFLES